MDSIKSKGLEPKKEMKSNKIFKTSLALTLIVFAFTMSSPNSFFQIVKPAEAAGILTSTAILPTNNIVNTRTTYDILFKTATTATIKTIQMDFPSGFDVSAATRLIERSGIGSGSLSAPSSSTLIYTVSSAVSVSAGTTIRLEIGRVVNSDTAGNFKVTITTKNTSGGTIDGPTLSPSFPIKDISGDDISPSFMIKKTLKDDAAGHAHGWDPNGATQSFTITDPDISGPRDSKFIDILTFGSGGCDPIFLIFDTQFHVDCQISPSEGAELHYVITKLPEHVVTSSLPVSPSSTSSESSTSSSQYESLRSLDQIASEFP